MRLYILVREDLDPSYRMVQGMHAVAMVAQAFTFDHTTAFVCLKVKDERELIKWWAKMYRFPERVAAEWKEPDLGGQTTAIACLTKDGRLFKSLRLA